MKMSLRHNLRVAGLLGRCLWNEFQATSWGQYLGGRPVALNLLVNDICNSRCSMCNIWQRPQAVEIGPEELRVLLRDPLFAKVRYAGVSGGEPTLRPDLPEIYDSIVDSLPALAGTGIITNAVAPTSVIERVEASVERVLRRGRRFHLMVSLDGVGETHDAQRGKAGNFDKAIAVVRHFQRNGAMTVNVGCTVTRQNIHGLRTLRSWCADNGIEVRFRVAEFIDRLYNGAIQGVIRDFDDEQAYDAGLFFHELEHQGGLDEVTRRTYRNVRIMLLGGRRNVGCLWQAQGVTLDSGGGLLYCAPRSPRLGDARKTSASRIYAANLARRARILREHCGSCIHDYPAPLRLREVIAADINQHHRRRLALDVLMARCPADKPVTQRNLARLSRNEILIVGWYGTETAGDKAILGGVVERLRREYPDALLTLASLYPFVTKRTLVELCLPDVRIVDVYGSGFLVAARRAGLVVIGGGPLMHIEELGVLLAAFRAARGNGGMTWIMGCGIGPLHRAGRYKEAVMELLRTADRVELRDEDSRSLACELTSRSDLGLIEDPAVGFVHRWVEAHPRLPKTGRYLNCFLREWSSEYALQVGPAYERQRERFETETATMVRELCTQYGLTPRLLPMNHFWVGGDDRVFAERFARTRLAGMQSVIEWRPLTVDEVLAFMCDGCLNLCMRYHSVVFAHALGTDFLALDYTRGGKIAGFAASHGCAERVIDFDDIVDGRWRRWCGPDKIFVPH